VGGGGRGSWAVEAQAGIGAGMGECCVRVWRVRLGRALCSDKVPHLRRLKQAVIDKKILRGSRSDCRRLFLIYDG
jgi:hypothetical protein